MTPTSKVRTQPQLSVNQFAQYLEAKSRRRNTILRDQKFPNEITILYYKEAVDAIVDYIDHGFDEDVFSTHHELIGNKRPTTVQQVTRLKSCLEALESLQVLALNELEDCLDGTSLVKAVQNPPNGVVHVEGVDISLRPEFFVTATDKRGTPFKGLIKLYVSKNYPITDYTAKAIGALSLKFLENMGKPKGAPRPELVLIVDVFAKAIFTAPKATKQIMQDVQATCKEISRVWNSVSIED